MGTELTKFVVSLPEKAEAIGKEIATFKLIKVVDDKSNIAAAENLKYIAMQQKEFEELCKKSEVYQYFRTGLDTFNSLKKTVNDNFANFIKFQKSEIGEHEKSMMEAENARRIESAAQNGHSEDMVSKIDHATIDGTFTTAGVKMKPVGTVIDKKMFIDALFNTGNAAFINLIFDKINESQLNKFCQAMNLDGNKVNFPGLHVEMEASVRVR